MLQFYHNLPLLIRVHTTLLASMCHAMPFWTRALKKRHFLWHSYRVKTNQNVVSWSVLLSTMGTLHYSFPKQCFLIVLIASACWASLQKFLKGKLTRTRFLSLSLISWYKTNRMWLSVVCILIDNDTGHHSRQDLLWNHWFIHACRQYKMFTGI